MSNVVELPSCVDRVEQATDWASKIDRGLTDIEEAQFVQWLSADEANIEVFKTVAVTWDNMNSLARLGDMFPEPEHKPGNVRYYQVVGLAASLLLAVTLVFKYVDIDRGETAGVEPHAQVIAFEQIYETAVGEQSVTTLSDGSVLSLNTDTRIEEKYSLSERALILYRGELHIRVAHQPDRPLRVYVGDRVVQAVGTEFSVEVTPDQDIEVIVTEGRVRVSLSELSSQGVVPETLDSSAHATVSAGEQIILARPSEQELAQAKVIEPEEIEVKLSWRGGNLVFRGESLEEAITEIERYTQVEFVILDESLKKVQVAGLFRAGDVEGLLKTLRDNFDVSYERVADDKIHLSQGW